MYKVIIIDDENIIVEGLKRVVDWAKYDCTVVATAYDAAEGTLQIRTHRPDIVFTDIKMPDMDGLTMLAGLKGEFHAMQITVLTGYRDFEYAKRAINLGVTRFLLKPSKMNEIDEALEAMTERLRSRDAQPKVAKGQEVTEETPAGNFIIKSAVKYIEEHYAEKLSLSDVADKIYVSQWYLSKLLNRYTDKSFCDLLNQTRIDHAKELLRDPSLRIQDVSEVVGFGDVAHFSRCFKKMEGHSPNEYRNLM